MRTIGVGSDESLHEAEAWMRRTFATETSDAGAFFAPERRFVAAEYATLARAALGANPRARVTFRSDHVRYKSLDIARALIPVGRDFPDARLFAEFPFGSHVAMDVTAVVVSAAEVRVTVHSAPPYSEGNPIGVVAHAAVAAFPVLRVLRFAVSHPVYHDPDGLVAWPAIELARAARAAPGAAVTLDAPPDRRNLDGFRRLVLAAPPNFDLLHTGASLADRFHRPLYLRLLAFLQLAGRTPHAGFLRRDGDLRLQRRVAAFYLVA